MKTQHPTRPPPSTPAGDVLLRVGDLHVRYGGIEALKGVSLEVRRGEVVALIGANGAGKTTTLRAIARLQQPSGGSIAFDKHNLVPLGTEDAVALGISLVPEGRGVFPNLTVRENLELGAWNHRAPAVMAEGFDDVVKLFPRLGERMKQEAGTLSGGEQQMLAIGRALMARPTLLLLDEPSLGIAPKLVAQIFEAIRAVASAGTTILVVEQNTRVALGSSQRAYVMRTGEIAREGPSRELADDPEIQKAYLGGLASAEAPAPRAAFGRERSEGRARRGRGGARRLAPPGPPLAGCAGWQGGFLAHASPSLQQSRPAGLGRRTELATASAPSANPYELPRGRTISGGRLC